MIVSIFVYTFGGKKPVPKKETGEEQMENGEIPKEKTEKEVKLENPMDVEKQPMLKEEVVLTGENGTTKNVQDGA